jgi:hypothetical protein
MVAAHRICAVSISGDDCIENGDILAENSLRHLHIVA